MPLRSKPYSLTVPTALPARGSRWERLQHWIAIGGPIGLFPWVPATLASAIVAALCWWQPPSWPFILVACVVLLLVGGFAATTSERLLGVEDPRNVVLDEIAGQLLSFLFVAPFSAAAAVAGFLLFRLFDVTKPPPARQAERLPGGWGIMTDDLIAGLYAAFVLWLLARALR
ncbi:MAG: phosphatidylglycerophosphatase A family protein [Terriglobales bacterium]